MKKTLPLLLALALLLAACSFGNTAPEQTQASTVIVFDGTRVEIRGGGARDTGSQVLISAAGTYEVRGSGSDKCLVIDTGDDAMNVTLILNGLELTCLSGPAIHVRQAKHFRLQLAEGSSNRLVSGTPEFLDAPDPNADKAALYSEDDMDIEGAGSLEICGYRNNGIGCKDDLDINGGSITVLAANNGVKGNDSVQIKGGELHITAGGDGIKTSTADREGKGFVEISDGFVEMDVQGDGIQAATELRILGGTVCVLARGDGVQQSSRALRAETGVFLSGGSVTLNSQEDAVRCGVGDVVISGGTLEVTSQSTGIQAGKKDSAVGDVRIEGGSVSISSAKQAVKAQGAFSVSGGSLLALFGSEKQAEPRTESGYLFGALSGDEGRVVKAEGFGSMKAGQTFRWLLLCAESLHAGDTVTVFCDETGVTFTAK